jgi:hypothetical protein
MSSVVSDRTRVHITVDVECAEERVIDNSKRSSQGYDLRVWGRLANQRRELGIDLLMREMHSEGLSGTFYLEVLGANFWGLDELREVVKVIRRRGNDVQLHMHPVLRVPHWYSRNIIKPSDNIGDYSLGYQTALLNEGIDILSACDIPRDEIVSFRAGNFGANNVTWAAMAQAGLKVSSNYNPCYFTKNCHMSFQQASSDVFEAEHGIVELPISCLKYGEKEFRHMQIAAVSLDEMKYYLLKAHAAGMRNVTIVTHSFELYHIDDTDKKIGRINSVNLNRFRGLCKFLSANSDKFKVETINDFAKTLPLEVGVSRDYIKGNLLYKSKRLIEQAYKRFESKIRFDRERLVWS